MFLPTIFNKALAQSKHLILNLALYILHLLQSPTAYSGAPFAQRGLIMHFAFIYCHAGTKRKRVIASPSFIAFRRYLWGFYRVLKNAPE